MTRPRAWLVALGLLVLAFAARGAMGGLTGQLTAAGALAKDEWEYFQVACAMAAGRGHVWLSDMPMGAAGSPTAYRVPGTSLFLASVVVTVGPNVVWARWAMALAASTSALLAFLVAQRIGPSGAAVLTGLAVAVHPAWVFYSPWLLSEAIFVPLLLVSAWAYGHAWRSGRPRDAIGTGALLGATALCRPHALPIAALAALAFLFCREHPRQAQARSSAVIVIGTALMFAPWIVRNTLVLGTPVLATETGETLLGTNNPRVLAEPELYGMWVPTETLPQWQEARARVPFTEVELDRAQRAMALEFLRDHPRAIPRLVLNKLTRWLTPWTRTGGMVHWAALIPYVTLLTFLVIGAWRGSLTRSPELGLLGFALITTFVFFGLTAVFWGNLVRGRLPLEVLWAPWA